MESIKHEIVSSHEIYKFGLLEINFHICKPLTGGNVFDCFTRRNFKSHDEKKLNKPSFEYNFYCPRDVMHNMLQELAGAIKYVNTLHKEWSNNTTEGLCSEVTRRHVAFYYSKEYYLAIKQRQCFRKLLYLSPSPQLERYTNYGNGFSTYCAWCARTIQPSSCRDK